MNYGQLKAALVAYTHRSDLDSIIPTFLELAEQRIYFGEDTANAPAVRVAAMRASVSLANGARPADFIEAIKVNRGGKSNEYLEYVPLQQMPRYSAAYNWDGDTLVLSQYEKFPVDLIYYKKLQTPSADSDTNWIIGNAPQVYISSLLVEYARWARDDVLGAREAGIYVSTVRALNSRDMAASISGGALRMRKR